MDLKKEAAKKAVTFIQNGTAVGLGAGATMAYMVEYLHEKKEALDIRLYTSSGGTRVLLQQCGFVVNDVSSVSHLNFYFDGCDQFDSNLNALKSGGGIHTMEKLLASMADEFILVGDESKYTEHLGTKYPLVLEVLPQAVCFVSAKIKEHFTGSTTNIRRNSLTHQLITTENGNHLLDILFSEPPEWERVNPVIKEITGVVETSLFYNIANKAIIAGEDGIRVITKP